MKNIVYKDIANDTIESGILLDNGILICQCCNAIFPPNEMGKTWELIEDKGDYNGSLVYVTNSVHGTLNVTIYNPSKELLIFFYSLDVWSSKGYKQDDGGISYEIPYELGVVLRHIPLIKNFGTVLATDF